MTNSLQSYALPSVFVSATVDLCPHLLTHYCKEQPVLKVVEEEEEVEEEVGRETKVSPLRMWQED